MKNILIILFLFCSLFSIGQSEVNGKLKVQDSISVVNSTNSVTLGYRTGIRLNGTSTVWDDLMFPFSTGTNGGTGYPAFNPDSMYYAFSVDTTGPSKCSMYFIIQVPHKSKTASELHPHVHFKQEGVGTPTFKIKYKVYNIGATTQKGYSWITLNTPITSITDKTHGVVNGGNIQLSGLSLSAILIVNVYLTQLAAGTTVCNAWQFDLHSEIDSQGSDTEYVKD
jgi:hypothetical protein